MNYTRQTFTQPVSSGHMSHTEYEIRVGLRCALCSALMTAKHVCPKESK